MSWCFFPWVYPIRDCLRFLDLGTYFLSHVREVLDYCCFSVAKSCSALCNPMSLHHASLPYPSLSSGVFPNSYPLSRWCHPTISSSVALFSSCPQPIISSNIFSYHFFLSSSSRAPIILMLVHLMLSQWLLRVSLFLLFFLYSALLQLFPLFYLPAHLSVFLPQIVFYLFFLVYFKSQLLCCLLLIVYSLIPLGPG